MNSSNKNDTILLRISNLVFSYCSNISADAWKLYIADFSINNSDLCLIKGNNMSGKSTFLNIVAGIQPVENKSDRTSSFTKSTIHSIANLQRLSKILSNSDDMFPDLSIWDNVRIALPNGGWEIEKKQRKGCERFLDRSDVFSGKSIDDPLGSLSTGAKALVKLCRAHISASRIVVIDELTSYLDDSRSRFFLDFVMELIENGAAVLIVSHSERDRNYLLEKSSKSGRNTRQISIIRKGNVSELVYEN